MKLKPFLCVAAVSLATVFAFADQGDVMITFSTPGTDFYADGKTPVVNGEWYALCWSTNSAFGGFKTDGSALCAGDEVVLAAPLAKGGRCPFTAFEFAQADKYKSGKFFVMLLDTRDSSGKPAAAWSDVFVKNGIAASSVAKGEAMTASATTATAAGGVSVAWNAPTELGQNQIDQTQAATVKSFEIVGANVKIVVQSTTTAVDPYFIVRTGDSVDRMNTYSITSPESGSVEVSKETGVKTATFIVPQSKGKFFSVGTLAK